MYQLRRTCQNAKNIIKDCLRKIKIEFDSISSTNENSIDKVNSIEGEKFKLVCSSTWLNFFKNVFETQKKQITV